MLEGGGGIFHNSLIFVKGCFAISLHHILAFEAELLVVIYTLESDKQNLQANFWVECDSK